MAQGANWKYAGELNIASGQLSISDTSYFYDSPVVVPLKPGMYTIHADIAEWSGEDYVRTVRIEREHNTRRGACLGKVQVDFGQIGLCDRAVTEEAFERLGDDKMHLYFDQLNTTELFGTVSLQNGTIMMYFRPGFGDGTYRIYELLDAHGGLLGVEIDCLIAGEPATDSSND